MDKKKSGELDLSKLLASMTPNLAAEQFVFISIERARRADLKVTPLCEFQEAEGVTLVITREAAERMELEYSFPCRLITLKVHSDLSAVGFLAVITSNLAKAGISVNAVSAFYHDHLFVPWERADDAMAILENLAVSSNH